MRQAIEGQCAELVKKEIELAEQDPIADMNELMTNVYLDNSKRIYKKKQISSEENSTARVRDPRARNIDSFAFGYCIHQ